MMVIDVDCLIEEIDDFLDRSAHRDLFSTVEVQNMLLDLRMLLKAESSQD